MAKKKQQKKTEYVLERTYNVPLRKQWLKAPYYKRSSKAIKALKAFLTRHMKSENIKLGKNLNQKIWGNGIKNPPHHIKITAKKDNEGVVRAEAEGFKIEEPKSEEKSEKLEKEFGKLQEKTQKIQQSKGESKETQSKEKKEAKTSENKEQTKTSASKQETKEKATPKQPANKQNTSKKENTKEEKTQTEKPKEKKSTAKKQETETKEKQAKK